jgi:diguanylate cyclase (GGDEF)-like protein
MEDDTQSAQADEQKQGLLSDALRDIASVLNSTLQLEEVLDRILANLGKVVPHDAVNIMLVELGIARIVRCPEYVARGLEDSMRDTAYSIAGTPTLRKMAETGQPLIISDTLSSNLWTIHPDTDWVRSYVGAPIRVYGNTVGFINLDSATPNFYAEEQARRLQAFADQTAIAVHNAMLFEEMQQLVRGMRLLNDITRIAIHETDTPKMYQRLADRLGELLQADTASLLVGDSQEQSIDLVATYGQSRDNHANQAAEAGRISMARSVLEAGVTLIADNTAHSPYITPEQAAHIVERSLLGLPLVADGRGLGVALLGYNKSHQFSTNDLWLGKQAADQIALALAKLQLYEEVQQLAITDELTGLINRRGLFEFGRREIERSLRFGRPLSVIMLDIDYFKQVNDQFGHFVGDQVLRGLAQLCRQNVREVDILTRYGGEEFAILLLESDKVHAYQVAERLRKVIEHSRIPTDKEQLQVTISLGVATLAKDVQELESLLEMADQALYIAKQSGRNKTVAL